MSGASGRLAASVRGLLEDFRDDAATKLKVLLWAVFGVTGLVLALVLIGQDSAPPFFAFQADLRVLEKFHEEGMTAMVATVCPVPLRCPEWCNTRNHTCQCQAGQEVEWGFLRSAGIVGANCTYVNKKGEHVPFQPEDVREPALVPIESHDGRRKDHDHCLQLNWRQQWKKRGRDAYITCNLHSQLRISSWDTAPVAGLMEPYEGAAHDAIVAVQFHANPEVFPPKKDMERFYDRRTGVRMYSNAWTYTAPFTYAEYQLQPVIFRAKEFSSWNTKVTVHNQVHLPVSGRHDNSANGRIPIAAIEWYYLRAELGTEWLTEIDEGDTGARHALGVAGGLAFLFSLLNMAVFCVATTSLGWRTDAVQRRMAAVGGDNDAMPYRAPGAGGAGAYASPYTSVAAASGGSGGDGRPINTFGDGTGAPSQPAGPPTVPSALKGAYGSIGDA